MFPVDTQVTLPLSQLRPSQHPIDEQSWPCDVQPGPPSCPSLLVHEPPMQDSPLQHGSASSQLAFIAPQAPALEAEQVPFWQLIPPQQSPSCEQLELLQPQVWFTHRPEQQVDGSLHPSPSCWQPIIPPKPGLPSLPFMVPPVLGTHEPLSQAIPLQQSPTPEQVPPLWEQPQ